MRYTHKCDTRCTRFVGKGVKVSYDGECCLAVERGDYQTAITAYPGEIVTLIYSRGQATTVQGIKKPLAK